jgi:hypothetical protein
VKRLAKPWDKYPNYDCKPVKRAIDIAISVACFAGLLSLCRLYPGLLALGFILSPAPQAATGFVSQAKGARPGSVDITARR